jgi:hypothetical protein
MSRGRLICVTGTTPNSDEEGVVFGGPKMGVFRTLNADALNCNWWFSWMWKMRISVASYCGLESVRMLELLSFAVRKVSGGRITQMLGEVLNQ